MTLSTALRRETPLFVFDGVCVLCSEGASFIMRHDPGGQVQFASAQSDLGRAIYEKMGLPIDSSYLLVDSAGTHAKTDGYFQLARILGGWFRLGLVFRIVPRPVRTGSTIVWRRTVTVGSARQDIANCSNRISVRGWWKVTRVSRSRC
jgi:predicted DCC family thiol-disulfide oxidoreductase YuxK